MAPVTGIVAGTTTILHALAGLFPSSNDKGSVVRLQVGLNSDGGLQAAGGDVSEGSFIDIEIDLNKGMSGQQSTDLDLSEVLPANNRICIASIGHTSSDGSKYGWLGDWGANCGANWYYSNTAVDDQGNKTKCVWFDRSHSTDVKFNSLKLHMRSLSKQEDHPPEWNCENSEAVQFRNNGDKSTFWPVDVTVKDRDTKTAEVSANAKQARKNTRAVRKRSAQMEVEVEYVISNHTAEETERLCSSPSSFGPNFVSLTSNQFCDMETKTVWPLCNTPGAPESGCFDLETKEIRPNSRAVRKRSAQMQSELVVSSSSGQSAASLCSNPSSFGPDFVDLANNQFCDMETKTLLPLCNTTGGPESACFDLETKQVKSNSPKLLRSRGVVDYSRVTVWK